jgi:hypothetical protein
MNKKYLLRPSFYFLVLFTFTNIHAYSQQRHETEKEKQLLEELKQEIKSIHNSETLFLFLMNHAATYQDFDSLYIKLENKPCPKDFTFDLVNGNAKKEVNVGKLFLYLITRNFQNSFELPELRNESDIKSGKFDCFYNNFSSAYKIIRPNIKGQMIFSIDSISTDEIVIDVHRYGYISVKNNIKSIIRQMMIIYKNERINFFSQDEENKESVDFSLKQPLKIYRLSPTNLQEESIDNQISNQESNLFVSDLGGTIIAENVYSYISAQLFHDVGFVFINNKFIFLDVDQ